MLTSNEKNESENGMKINLQNIKIIGLKHDYKRYKDNYTIKKKVVDNIKPLD